MLLVLRGGGRGGAAALEPGAAHLELGAAHLGRLEKRVAQLEDALLRLEQRCGTAGSPADSLVEQAAELSQRGDIEGAQAALRRARAVQPGSRAARIQLGLLLVGSRSGASRHEGVALLEQTFERDAEPEPLYDFTPQGVAMMQVIGSVHERLGDSDAAEKWFCRAAASPSGTDCARIQCGTVLTQYPASREAAAASIARFHRELDALLARPGPLSVSMGFLGGDPFFMCFNSAFAHSFYYDSDARESLGKYIRVAAKAFPELLYTAPHLAPGALPGPGPGPEPGPSKKLRLGVASAFFGLKSSVILDFGGVLDRLPRDRFEVTLVRLLGETSNLGTALGGADLYAGRPGDAVIEVSVGEPDWLGQLRSRVGALRLDVLLYLDSTMSSMATKLSMSRLARVQAVSHGHPMTSGVDKGVMDYFVSWAAAELLPSAAEHYTEELVLLPADSVHQWYEPRVPHGVSDVSGQPFLGIERAAFAAHAPADGHWYVCMQVPFKRQPEFDAMLAAVLRRDPRARLLLSAPSVNPDEKVPEAIHTARLRRAGADMARVHFVPIQPHHRLMALYRLSDVVLDSYPASGCTTTREALEAGALIVTLPAKYLGSRWTLGYYSIMGVTDLVAHDAADYVEKAVRVASDAPLAAALRRRMRDALPRIWRQHSAVDNWVTLLTRMATARKAASS